MSADITTPLVDPVELTDVDQAVIAEWEGMDPLVLFREAEAERAAAKDALMRANDKLAAGHVLATLAVVKATAEFAAANADAADQRIPAAAAALAKATEPVEEVRARIRDLGAAYAAADAMPEPDIGLLKQLARDATEYRQVLADVEKRLIAPQDQLATAQREARLAHGAAAAAAAKVDAVRAQLLDVRHAKTPARSRITLDSAIDVTLAIVNGDPVHPDDDAAARDLIESAASDLGVIEPHVLRERWRIEKLLGLSKGWEESRKPWKL